MIVNQWSLLLNFKFRECKDLVHLIHRTRHILGAQYYWMDGWMDNQYTNENLRDKERRGKPLNTNPPNTNPPPIPQLHEAWQQNSHPCQFHLFFIQILFIQFYF